MPFLSISFPLSHLDADAAESACFATGALAVTLGDERDDAVLEPAPGEVRLWPATRVEATYAQDAASPATLAALAAVLGLPVERLEVRAIADRVWEREWLADFHAMRFGQRLHVCPTHEEVTTPDAVVVRLDPGLAFGTGTHPTTAMCLEWLDAGLEPGGHVIDFGCGSGILGIAAAKLGAARVDAFDIDPQALVATRDNAAANGIADRVLTHERRDTLPRDADLVLANILSGPLVDLASQLTALVRPGGQLVLAGLLATQADEVAAAYDAAFDITRARVCDGWQLLVARKRHEPGSEQRRADGQRRG
ncbi:MAG: Ribosomal protein L11 methyltransferase [Steroidobacteraceae bacterium]|nr:Ribosomal protein L11 methyltransferase [Steroidobacteraceae bacterium]